MKQLNSRLFKVLLTKRIAQLHDEGFCHDFLVNQQQEVICLQNSQHFKCRQVSIRLVDLFYEHQPKKCYYIHTVETETGIKGLLIDGGIFFNNTGLED